MHQIAEHSEAIITRDVPEVGLHQEDVGTVVSIQFSPDGTPEGYTLEIYSIIGESLGVRNVDANAVRAASSEDITHARPASA
jgi:hypothetical protein